MLRKCQFSPAKRAFVCAVLSFVLQAPLSISWLVPSRVDTERVCFHRQSEVVSAGQLRPDLIAKIATWLAGAFHLKQDGVKRSIERLIEVASDEVALCQGFAGHDTAKPFSARANEINWFDGRICAGVA